LQGPTPLSSLRVSVTFAPSARSSFARRLDTSQVKACSGYPSLVEVPVVSHALVPLPIRTFLLISAGWSALPPLCPGSMTITLPASAGASSFFLPAAAGDLSSGAGPSGAGAPARGGFTGPSAAPGGFTGPSAAPGAPEEPPHAVSAPRHNAMPAATGPPRRIRTRGFLRDGFVMDPHSLHAGGASSNELRETGTGPEGPPRPRAGPQPRGPQPRGSSLPRSAARARASSASRPRTTRGRPHGWSIEWAT